MNTNPLAALFAWSPSLSSHACAAASGKANILSTLAGTPLPASKQDRVALSITIKVRIENKLGAI